MCKFTSILFLYYDLNFAAGSLIKHQLVSHLTLGIALRVVLDALRKSVDSKVSFSVFFVIISDFSHP